MPSGRFSVITDDGYSVLTALSTRLSREAWNIKVGDRVTVQLSIEMPVPGRIIRLATPRTATDGAAGEPEEGPVAHLAEPEPADVAVAIDPEDT